MLNEKSQIADYSNIEFLYKESKRILSKNTGGLSKNQITNIIIGDNWKEYHKVYNLLGNVLGKYIEFRHEKGKYILKPNLT
ncbi:MAG: hypothetical protein WA139_03865 [Candidatus Aenigmatarchaeota archaeon]